jgi:hypothetical protein
MVTSRVAPGRVAPGVSWVSGLTGGSPLAAVPSTTSPRATARITHAAHRFLLMAHSALLTEWPPPRRSRTCAVSSAAPASHRRGSRWRGIQWPPAFNHRSPANGRSGSRGSDTRPRASRWRTTTATVTRPCDRPLALADARMDMARGASGPLGRTVPIVVRPSDGVGGLSPL